MPVDGICAPDFDRVADKFRNNFKSSREIGASLCVILHGKIVVDLWGGYADLNRQALWQRNTLCRVNSITKAATALCAQVLIDRGELNPDAPVSHYWSKFQRAAKHQITVRMLLNHSAGLPAFRKPLSAASLQDWDYVKKRLEVEEPFWEPGLQVGYHAVTYGWLVGNLIRQVSGMMPSQFFAQEIAQPNNLDFHLQPDSAHLKRAAQMRALPPYQSQRYREKMSVFLGEETGVRWLALMNPGLIDLSDPQNQSGENNSFGAVANARSVAGLFGLAMGQGSSGIFEHSKSIDNLVQESAASDNDVIIDLPTRYSQGMMLSMDNRHKIVGKNDSFVIGPNAFGHAGFGGAAGFADLSRGLSFGYTMNGVSGGRLLNKRGQSLVDATYECLDTITKERLARGIMAQPVSRVLSLENVRG